MNKKIKRRRLLSKRRAAEFKNIQGKIRHVFKKDMAAERKLLLGYCRCNLQTLRAAIGSTGLSLKYDKMSGMYELRPTKVIADLSFSPTGRLSKSEPTLQNIRTERSRDIMRAFLPGPQSTGEICENG